MTLLISIWIEIRLLAHTDDNKIQIRITIQDWILVIRVGLKDRRHTGDRRCENKYMARDVFFHTVLLAGPLEVRKSLERESSPLK